MTAEAVGFRLVLSIRLLFLFNTIRRPTVTGTRRSAAGPRSPVCGVGLALPGAASAGLGVSNATIPQALAGGSSARMPGATGGAGPGVPTASDRWVGERAVSPAVRTGCYL